MGLSCFFVLVGIKVYFSHLTPWTAEPQASLSITSARGLLKLMSIQSVMPSNHLVLCHPLLLLPSTFPIIRIFSNESVLIRWPKYKVLRTQHMQNTLTWIIAICVYFLISPKEKETKAKINERVLTELKSFCTAKETATKWKDNLLNKIKYF